MVLQIEEWVYTGPRVTKDNKRAHQWFIPERDTYVLYTKLAGILGGAYLVTVDRTDDKVIVHGKPEFKLAQHSRLRDNPDWVVMSNAAEVRLRQLKRERAAARGEDSLDVALERLMPYAKACRTSGERDALIATVIRRLLDAW